MLWFSGEKTHFKNRIIPSNIFCDISCADPLLHDRLHESPAETRK